MFKYRFMFYSTGHKRPSHQFVGYYNNLSIRIHFFCVGWWWWVVEWCLCAQLERIIIVYTLLLHVRGLVHPVVVVAVETLGEDCVTF